MATKTVTDQSFATDVLGSEGPVLVDFWAEWCGPCRMIAPALEEIAGELGDKVTVAKLNIDENPDTPSRYGVRGIPTMLLFKGGQPVAQKVGAAPRSQISAVARGPTWTDLQSLRRLRAHAVIRGARLPSSRVIDRPSDLLLQLTTARALLTSPARTFAQRLREHFALS